MPQLSEHVILGWLREEDPAALERLFAEADRVRREGVGEAVHLRGLIEISSHCVRQCHYCGLRAPREIARYRMSAEEILRAAHLAHQLGFGTTVLQAGEDFGITAEWLAEVIRRIKRETPRTAIYCALRLPTPDFTQAFIRAVAPHPATALRSCG
jgi:biotin synthase